MKKQKIVFIAHYFPPINSSGAKRVEALSAIFSQYGREVTVITTQKLSGVHGDFTEPLPVGVDVIHLGNFGIRAEPKVTVGIQEPMYLSKPSFKRKIKDLVMGLMGQIPDPRLFFAFGFVSPFLDKNAKKALLDADVIIGSSPPWTMILAAYLASRRFKKKLVFDIRDQFSNCHEMPGSRISKKLEFIIDKYLCKRSGALVAISSPMKEYYSGMAENTHVIMNGYDSERMNVEGVVDGGGDEIVIRYMGIVSPGRVPKEFISALALFLKNEKEFPKKIKIEFYGHADLVLKFLEVNYPELIRYFFFYSPVPYIESMRLIKSCDYALFAETSDKSSLSAQGILTTKLFEYIGSGSTILANISKNTLAGETIEKAGSHHILENSMEGFLLLLNGKDFWSPAKRPVNDFGKSLSRQEQAKQYLDVIDGL